MTFYPDSIPVTTLDEAGQKIFWRHATSRKWLNGTLMKRRNFDGHIVSMPQSGSHWLKNMLSDVLADKHGLPKMAHIQDDSIIGHPKSPPKYKNIPKLVHSHSYPHAVTLRVPGLHYPRYLVLVRDIKASLVAHYERFNETYYKNADFSAYLRGDLRQRAYFSDIYSRIRFMNEWGDLIARHPDRVMGIRYEDMQTDAASALRRTCAFFNIDGVSDEQFAHAAAANTRDKMLEKPKNPDVHTTVVRAERRPVADYFSAADNAFFDEACRTFLQHDFGYAYETRHAAA